ncbi:MAG: hypothetical protein ACK4XY_10135 [Chloroherpetonaceae bacterium]
MEILSVLSGAALFLGLCLDFPRQIVQAYFTDMFRTKEPSMIALELNPNQN